MYLSTIADWLSYIASLHPFTMDLGLDRVREVARRLQVLSPGCPVILVGGTNGKGSTVAGLETIYHAAGYQVGAFTSPFLFRYNEQVRINRQMLRDQAFCDAFAQVENVRGEITLTPFEYTTLAALTLFRQFPLDVWILEVGLGGRLDAVNILDATLAIITSIDKDHMEWLGDSREKIAWEKAGIFRAGQLAICGDKNPPSTLFDAIARVGAKGYIHGCDFQYQEEANSWFWRSANVQYDHLPYNALATQNMAIVLMAITLLNVPLPVTQASIITGLQHTHLPGRVEVREGSITEIFDVAHNPAAIAYLNQRLKKMRVTGKTYAVFSMLADKDIVASINAIAASIDAWYVAPLPLSIKRAATYDELVENFAKTEAKLANYFDDLSAAYDAAKQKAVEGDRLLIFGSFHTVAAINHPEENLNCATSI